MATLMQSIELNDRFTPVLNNIRQAMSLTISRFEKMQQILGNDTNVSTYESIKNVILNVGKAISGTQKKQEELNDSIKEGDNESNKLWDTIQNLSFNDVLDAGKKLVNLSEQMTATNANLNVVNDGLQTNEELQQKVFDSAQRSRTAYMDTAATVSKLGMVAGSAFSSNDEMITFAEQMNKQFKLSGASVEDQASTMDLLTQAMASGNLEGSQFENIMKSAPLLAQSIADNMGKTVGELGQMSSEGSIASDVIKNALLSSAGETNDKFAELPMTFCEMVTAIKNNLLQTFQPVFEIISSGAQWIVDNWGMIEPIFWGVTAAVGAYGAGLLIAKAITSGFFTTLLSNPITWIAIAIGLVVGLIYQWVKSVGGIKIAWLIATNTILTAWDQVKIGFFTGVYWIINLFSKLKLIFAKLGVHFLNCMGDLKVGVLLILQKLINDAIGLINKFIGLINKITGASISLVQEVTFGETAKLENEAKKKAREAELEDYENEIKSGIKSRDEKIKQMKDDALAASAKRQDEIKQKQEAANNIKQEEDNSNNKQPDRGSPDNPMYTNSTVDNTVDVSSEDLKIMRDIAEMQAIQNFVTLTPTVKVTTGDIHKDVDVSNVVEKITNSLNEEVSANVKGAYNV